MGFNGWSADYASPSTFIEPNFGCLDVLSHLCDRRLMRAGRAGACRPGRRRHRALGSDRPPRHGSGAGRPAHEPALDRIRLRARRERAAPSDRDHPARSTLGALTGGAGRPVIRRSVVGRSAATDALRRASRSGPSGSPDLPLSDDDLEGDGPANGRRPAPTRCPEQADVAELALETARHVGRAVRRDGEEDRVPPAPMVPLIRTSCPDAASPVDGDSQGVGPAGAAPSASSPSPAVTTRPGTSVRIGALRFPCVAARVAAAARSRRRWRD